MARNKTTTISRAQRCAVLATTLACAACSALNSAGGETPPTGPGAPPSDGYTAALASYVEHTGVCLDGTISTATVQPHFAARVRDELVTVVSGWAPEEPATSGGARPRPGLQLRVRSVQTRSLSSSKELVVSVPAVEGLRSEPDPTDKDFVAHDAIWQKAQARVNRELVTARVAAARAAKSLRTFVAATGYSDIWGCLSAVSTDLPAGHRSLVGATDGLQTGSPEIAPNFAHTRVLFVMPCPSGNAKTCLNTQRYWRTQVSKRGAVRVAFLRPEAADVNAYRSFIIQNGG